MFRFWNSVIAPILTLGRPRVIVEVGSERGHHTHRLLEHAAQTHATLHVVDPAPLFDPETFAEPHQREAFCFHRATSHEVLSQFGDAELVLLDGDHNWYTVKGELKLIAEATASSHRPFPVTLLHDVSWPYGKRDLYYAPERIPADSRQPYARKGIVRGRSKLAEQGGYNDQLHNAVEEGGPRNGVLTGVEDFLHESALPLELIHLPVIWGLGIVYSPDLAGTKPELFAYLQQLQSTPAMQALLEDVEDVRISTEVEYNALARQVRRSSYLARRLAAVLLGR